MAEQRSRLRRAAVRPQDGVVAKRAVEGGQVVSAGQTVFTLPTDGEREVLMSLPEQGFGRFKIGQPVAGGVAEPARPTFYRAHCVNCLPQPTEDRDLRRPSGVYRRQVPRGIGPKRSAYSIQTEGVVPLSVPLSALSAENGASYVWRVETDNTLKRVPVRIGAFGEKPFRCWKA